MNFDRRGSNPFFFLAVLLIGPPWVAGLGPWGALGLALLLSIRKGR